MRSQRSSATSAISRTRIDGLAPTCPGSAAHHFAALVLRRVRDTRTVMPDKEPSSMERLKARSRYLRGDLAEDLADPITGGVSEDSAQLLKFHGMYLQDNRDLRPERTKKKL